MGRVAVPCTEGHDGAAIRPNYYLRAMEFIKELWQFLRQRKKWWLLPMIVVLLLIGVLIIFTAGSAIAPFIYTLF